MDVALNFDLNGGTSTVALWAHRSVLSQQPGLKTLLDKLKDVEGSSTEDNAIAGAQSYHVTEYSLEAYCSLIRFLYTCNIELDVNLNDFAIGSPTNKPFSIACKKRPVFEILLFSSVSFSSNYVPGSKTQLVRSTTFGELFQLADCYEVKQLRRYCREQIIESMTISSVLSILFGYAYRFDDLKCVVLEFVTKNLDKMFAGDKSPFEDFDGHPKLPKLMAEIMKLKFKTSV